VYCFINSTFSATDKAFKVLQDASSLIIDTQYNDKLFNFRTDAKQIMLNEYYHSAEKQRHLFHWEFMDDMSNGYYGGDVVSFVGRPAKGKTFMLLRSALENWRNLGAKPLVATMEMNYVAIMQRLSAMYGNVNLSQLRNKSFATSSEKLFRNSLNMLSSEQSDFYIVDGNLAATPEQIYTLAHNLGCDSVYIDGAYMLKSSNPRLDRFTRVAENVELMKQYTSNLDVPTVASWQG
jgi:replicative DNA helicase